MVRQVTSVRLTSEERRQHVLDAAVEEFAAAGYHATSTTTIAKRAGISQPYIYALFPNKRDLFLAVYKRCTDEIRREFRRSADLHSDPVDKFIAIAEAYEDFLSSKSKLLVLLHAYAAAADPELQSEIRAEYIRLFEDVEKAVGAPRQDFARFWATGMYMTIGAAMDLPADYYPSGPPGS
jgi:AcrR family transcriptional regulator